MNEKSEQISQTVSIIPVRSINANDETIEKVVKQKLATNDVNVLDQKMELLQDVMLGLSQ